MSQHLVRLMLVATGSIAPVVATAHESESRRVDPRAVGAIMPRLSASGDSIAFSYQGAIWRMARDGGPMTRLTGEGSFDVEPAWSPDGSKIALTSGPTFGGGTLAVIDAHSGQKIKLPRQVAALDKLHFDRTGQRVLGLF